MHERPASELELQPALLGMAFLLACVVLVTRRPDAIFHPQFYAEDGHVWFADAYNLGLWGTLFRTQDGYFQTLPRLGAALALLMPLSLSPLVLNLIAIAIQALPVSLLISARSSAWGSLRFRALLAVSYLVLPNCLEMIAIITSTQWILALCVFLLLVSAVPKGPAGAFLDISVVLLCALTGPFCFFLMPFAFFLAFKRNQRWRWITFGLLSTGCAIQAWGLLVVNPSGRAHAQLGANPDLFARILAGQVYLGALVGGNGLASLTSRGLLIFLPCVAVVGTIFVALCAARSGENLKLLLLLAVMLFLASLISPASYPPQGVSRWQFLAGAVGIRYWFFPTLAFAWSLLSVLHSRSTVLKTASAILLFVMCFGIVHDWRIPALRDMHFAEDARHFEAAPAGTSITIAENPPGWNVHLVKHSSTR